MSAGDVGWIRVEIRMQGKYTVSRDVIRQT